MKNCITAIICAMEEEIAAFRSISRDDILLIKSGVGKVNATIATMDAIHQGATRVISAGFAGSLRPNVRHGSILLPFRAIQHDMDATALGYKRSEIPYEKDSYWDSDKVLISSMLCSALSYGHTVHIGAILSGDQFIAGDREELRNMNGGCVDMETAAIAQACHVKGIAWAGIRLISDSANTDSPHDFQNVSTSSLDIIARIIQDLLTKWNEFDIPRPIDSHDN